MKGKPNRKEKRRTAKSILRLPDLEVAKSAVRCRLLRPEYARFGERIAPRASKWPFSGWPTIRWEPARQFDKWRDIFQSVSMDCGGAATYGRHPGQTSSLGHTLKLATAVQRGSDLGIRRFGLALPPFLGEAAHSQAALPFAWQ